jgi:proton glutamate symport protein
MLGRTVRFIRSPIAVLVAVAAGALLGLYAPTVAKALTPLSKIYIDLLKMVVLPFIISSIIFSLRSLIRDPKAAGYLAKVLGAVVGISLAAAAIGAILAVVMQPGVIRDPATSAAFGQAIHHGGIATDLEMTLKEPEAAPAERSMVDALLSFVPDNVFHALAEGDTIKVLVFALLFGFAVGRVPHGVSDPFAHTLDTVYRCCITLTHWFNFMLPFATFAMIADQVASVGPATLALMLDFLVVIGVATLIITVASLAVVSMRSGRSIWEVVRLHRDVLVMAVATRSSITCVPQTIETLAVNLGFRRVVVELLVPLQTALLRIGPVLLFAIAPIFIAQLYGKPLPLTDVLFVTALAALLGPTTAGMTGVLTLAQVGVVCGYLSLPFDAAFALFVAIDAFTDTIRTVAVVATVSGATAAIAPPEPFFEQAEDGECEDGGGPSQVTARRVAKAA